MIEPEMSRRATITFSLVLAVCSCLLLFSLLFALLAAIGSAGMAGYGFVKYGRRAWPTTLGIPFLVLAALQHYFLIYGGP